MWTSLAIGLSSLVVGYLARAYYDAVVTGKTAKQADAILEEARSEAERIKQEVELAVKEEAAQKANAFEDEIQRRRKEIRDEEKKNEKREKGLQKKEALVREREKGLAEEEGRLIGREAATVEKEKEVERLVAAEQATLEKVSGLKQEEARKLLLERLENELAEDTAAIIQSALEKARGEVDEKAREILTLAIQRCAVEHTADSVVSTIDIPADEMKGRIIGREGRNIRAFEKATGIDVVVDDTPGVIVVSGFDSLRRETAKRAMEKLIVDGRIHPARIEEVVKNTQQEMEEIVRETGKQIGYEANIHGLHQKITQTLGRLKFRTSRGQNVLQHSLEVCHLCGVLAGEFGLKANIARRVGLLHDIVKGLDHAAEGSHSKAGADLARRSGEKDVIVEAIASHHGEVEPTSIYGILVQVANEVSKARPGARKDSLEQFAQRMESLEAMAAEYEGVERAFAIQAGREVRLVVDPNAITDSKAFRIARDLAQRIENELTYPAEIRVTVLRESRIIEYVK